MDWQGMVLLGAWYGINPGMGWLFAVALGMQRGSGRAVWRALSPMVLGHVTAVGVVLVTFGAARIVVPPNALNVVVGLLLLALGGYRLWSHSHPRFGGMPIDFWDLATWSFLMATAHGAGFMVLPFVIPGQTAVSGAGHDHARHIAIGSTPPAAAAIALAIHTLAYFAVMAFVAWAVYRKLGLGLLRKAWFNLDWMWAGALAIAGMIVLLK
jgi:hypothetical protein